jgi:Fe-S cluster assembly iron-binding protein IscA
MLTVTEDATTLIRTLTRNADLSARSGLRIVVDPVHDSLSMSLASAPSTTDAVVGTGEARVFLSARASHRLDQRTLRAEISASRSLFFLGS